ncbi:MAG: thiamine pyrophosphate-dependent dehydrogenase E1 component subunit alpha [Dehalococcoidia bacterium]|nr:thiamine pyrophosphate-dependent dehydrogenase E1 component subunit alpha [Dehalococcoidia bacterium]
MVDTAGIPPETLLEIYETMCLSKAMDDRVWVLAHSGEIALAVSCHGHEALQVASIYALRRGYDWMVPYYRDSAAALAMGLTPRDMMLAFFARREDSFSGARQFPNHFSSRTLNILSGSSDIATQIPHGVGIALASKMRKEDRVTITYFGDGATSEGDFHEAMNFAAVLKIPVIFLCENNEYAISVPRRKQMAIDDISNKAVGYGMPGVSVDGRDVFAVYRAVQEAAARARRGEGPTLVVANTYRIDPHTSNDPDRFYRDPKEITEQRKHDPVLRFSAFLNQHGFLTEEQDAAIAARVAAQVDEATDYARSAPQPVPEDAALYLYGN